MTKKIIGSGHKAKTTTRTTNIRDQQGNKSFSQPRTKKKQNQKISPFHIRNIIYWQQIGWMTFPFEKCRMKYSPEPKPKTKTPHSESHIRRLAVHTYSHTDDKRQA